MKRSGWVISGLLAALLTGAMAQTEHSAAGSSSAKLQGVKAIPSQLGTSLEISINPVIKPLVTTLSDPDRLVLDFPDTVSESSHNRIAIKRDGIIAVRIGVQRVQPPVTRVVVDLARPRAYKLSVGRSKIVINLESVEATGTSTSQSTDSVDTDRVALGGGDQGSAVKTTASSGEPTGPTNNIIAAVVPSIGSSEEQLESHSNNPAISSLNSEAIRATLHRSLAESVQSDPDDSKIQSSQPSSSTQVSTSSAETDPAPRVSSIAHNGSNPGATQNQAMQMVPTSTPDFGASPSPSNHTDSALSSNGERSNGGGHNPSATSVIDPPSVNKAGNQMVPTKPAGDALASLAPTGPSVAPPLNTADVTPKTRQRIPEQYVIGEQDQLTITVWKEPELSAAVTVRPDGKITLPLINEVTVVGLTPDQLQNLLTHKLEPFINVPQVTVSVRQINSWKVYLIGEVGREGVFILNSSTTVLQLIAEAGGLKDFAKRKGIYILRTEHGKQMRYGFNYDKVIRGKDSEENIVLHPGDTVVVP